MPGGLEMDDRAPRRLRSEGNNRDIFAMVKQTMSDDHLIQPPILVYPQAFLDATQNFFNRINSTRMLLHPELEESRCEDLLELAQNMQSDFPHLNRGAMYLKSLAEGTRPIEPCGTLKFIESGPANFNNGGGLRLGQRPVPPRPYKLKVVFHHRAAWWWHFMGHWGEKRYSGAVPLLRDRWDRLQDNMFLFWSKWVSTRFVYQRLNWFSVGALKMAEFSGDPDCSLLWLCQGLNFPCCFYSICACSWVILV